MREMELISTNVDIIDNLKQSGQSQLGLNSSLAGLVQSRFPGQVAVHPSQVPNSGFITAPFLASASHPSLSLQDSSNSGSEVVANTSTEM